MFPSSGLIETEIYYSTDQSTEFSGRNQSELSGLTTDVSQAIPWKTCVKGANSLQTIN